MTSAECDHPVDRLDASFGTYFVGMLTDWRLWALGFGAGMVAGATTGALGVGQGVVGAAVGAPMGLYCAMRLGRVRKCGKCNKIVRFPLSKPPPGAATARSSRPPRSE